MSWRKKQPQPNLPIPSSKMFGDRLRWLMDTHGDTQMQLAKALPLRVAVINRYVCNIHLPTIPALVRIARYYDTSTDFLLGLSDIP